MRINNHLFNILKNQTVNITNQMFSSLKLKTFINSLKTNRRISIMTQSYQIKITNPSIRTNSHHPTNNRFLQVSNNSLMHRQLTNSNLIVISNSNLYQFNHKWVCLSIQISMHSNTIHKQLQLQYLYLL